MIQDRCQNESERNNCDLVERRIVLDSIAISDTVRRGAYIVLPLYILQFQNHSEHMRNLHPILLLF